MAAAGVLSTIAAFALPAGLPYDEPAHWSNVLFFAEMRRLPVLGELGVEYEGQQTPLYYVLASLLTNVTEENLFMVRTFGAVGFVALTGLTAAIASYVSRNRPLVTIAATAFIAFNPMLAVMSGSVQNDTWALVWGFLAIVLALRPVRGPRWLQGLAVGLAASLAILTKVSMAPLLIGLVVGYLLRRRVVEPVVAVAVAAAATGWWFVRNLVLYGDFTGQVAVGLTGAEFESEPASPVTLAHRVITYLTLPVEYVRNAIAAPPWVEVAAVIVGAVLVIGLIVLAVREWRQYESWGVGVVCLVAAASVAAWLIQSLFGWPVAFRTAYAALPLFAIAAGTATRIVRRRPAGIGVLILTSAAQLAACGWVLVTLLSVDRSSMI